MTSPDGANERDWPSRYLAAIELAVEEFVVRGMWPERAPFRRRLTQLGLDEIDLDDMLRQIPRSEWEATSGQDLFGESDLVHVSLEGLRVSTAATPLLDACIAIVRWIYAQYRAEGPLPAIQRPDSEYSAPSGSDEDLLAFVGADKVLLSRALEVLSSHQPSLLEGIAWVGGRVEAWSLNLKAIPYFKGVATLDDYIAAHERKTQDARARLQSSPFGAFARGIVDNKTTPEIERSPNTIEIFVVMPFSEAWSAGVYDLILRAIEDLKAPEGAVRVYRADEISAPGAITDQIKIAIETAGVVLADITTLNPNVMWELGYADGCHKSLVILNQDHASSPFDLYTRRQVLYSTTPTKNDQSKLVSHLVEALRSSFGHSPPNWLPG